MDLRQSHSLILVGINLITCKKGDTTRLHIRSPAKDMKRRQQRALGSQEKLNASLFHGSASSLTAAKADPRSVAQQVFRREEQDL